MSWVQARWEATPTRMFQKLRDVVKADFDAFKTLTGDGQQRRDQFHWEVSDSGVIFGIVDEGDAAMYETVRFCLDRVEGVISVEQWVVPARGGGGKMQRRWLARPVIESGAVPMLNVEPEMDDRGTEPFSATLEELSRRSLLDFFAGWE